MKFNRVEISNFLSIPEGFILKMEPRCRILVGINEVGKSNILRALSMLCKEIDPTSSDKREPLPAEEPTTNYFVRFIFNLDPQELDDMFSSLMNFILFSNIDKPLFKSNEHDISLKDFVQEWKHIIQEQNEIIYEINLNDMSKGIKLWNSSRSYEIFPYWKKIADGAPPKYTLQNGEEIDLANKYLIDIDEYKELPTEFLEETTPEYINSIVGKELSKYLANILPECIFWEYNEKNILPSKIDLTQFSTDPNICLPLKYMFQLAKYDDIPNSFQEARARSEHQGVNNLLTRVAKMTTKHFHSVWKDYKGIKFYLGENGPYIDAAIKDKENRYDFEKRSEGFKRFVTFLLMISARVKRKYMKETVILIDEPSLGLHPSAARFLREEIINISKTNYVVYSTHSIFMIDKDNIERHMIVQKKNEKTNGVDAKESNIFDEEVLYNALRYSIFETLKQKNILFEGWRDKKLFQVAIENIPSRHSNLRSKFSEVGLAHSMGVNFMRFMTPFF